MNKTKWSFAFLVVLYASITCIHATDILRANQTLRYGETIVSSRETFELGFFSPNNSSNHYVGIWYKRISSGTVVWVANRNTPLTDRSGDLILTTQGVLIIRNATGNVIWSSSANSSTMSTSIRNPVGQLLDSGNFMIYNQGDIIQENEDYIWQSFDFPTDNQLPGLKGGWNLVTGIERYLTSSKSLDDPSSGGFTARLDIKGYPQILVRNRGVLVFREGPWNGLTFSGDSGLRPNPIYSFNFVLNSKEIYYQFNLIDTSVLTRLVLLPTGAVQRLLWVNSTQQWTLYLSPQADNCETYMACGPFGSCNISNSPICECLKGFEPISPEQYRVADTSQGCRLKTPLDCGPTDGFNKYTSLKLPDTQGSWFNQTMTLEECKGMCQRNCSCSAYTSSNISGTRSGCLLWFGPLNDTKYAANGDDLYIKLPAPLLDLTENHKRSSTWRRVRVVLLPTIVVALVMLSICVFCLSKRKKQKKQGRHGNEFQPENSGVDEDLELPLFGLNTLDKATNEFSVDNKLGEGGFGPVYKGVLEDGQYIAVKRLAKTSTQGLHEFKNEVISIAKLQHRNLVKILGCCIEGDEKMLIYEYMPNKGLDSFIFNKTQSKLLDWPMRYQIIDGIARGLLYLHQDSRLRIIHRDLKASNILLDSEMNPKISDFGMARSFGGNQIEANTNRVVGTYGYMAPEYAGDGIFSVKSDVYSFGVLLLEIVCGERNRGFIFKDHSNNLIGHAWGLHKDGKSQQLVSKCLRQSINLCQILRSIHVGLLCVQHRPEDRPTMTSVILMFGNDGPLPAPKEPGFFVGGSMEDSSSSTNEISVTTLDGR